MLNCIMHQVGLEIERALHNLTQSKQCQSQVNFVKAGKSIVILFSFLICSDWGFLPELNEAILQEKESLCTVKYIFQDNLYT